MTRLQAVRRLLPFILPVVAVVATAIVYIKLGCQPGTGCENVTAMMAAQTPYQTPFEEFLSLWSFG